MQRAGTTIDLPMRGPGGEPVDLWRAIRSHGVVDLPPNRIDEAGRAVTFVLRLPGAGVRATRVAANGAGAALATIAGPPLDAGARAAAEDALRRMLRLDIDLSGFYRQIATDPDLAWAAAGAGRMVRGQSVFEDVVKTICTTNCAWSATERMVGAITAHLGEPALDAPEDRAFPTPEAMAAAPESFYREVARAGYRGAFLRTLAEGVAAGAIDLESLALPEPDGPPDDEVRRRLLALPGVGPYAAAHVMLLIGRCRPLVFDSWTRPTFARLHGAPLPGREIEARFDRYGPFAGLAFWLYLTRDWCEDGWAAPEAAANQA